MWSRRSFLKSSSIVSLSPVVPKIFSNSANAAVVDADQKILVVIQMDGGNDGINTVVPFRDDNYARSRKRLKLPEKKLHRLSDELGLHPSMKAAKELFDEGLFSVVQSVGYPNPDRSHFRSMRIWQTATFDDERHDQSGWLGRTLGHNTFHGSRNCVYVGTQETPVTLWGRKSNAISISRAEDLHLASTPKVSTENASSKLELEQFVTKKVLSAYDSAKEMDAIAAGKKSEKSYPRTRLGSQLQLIAKLLKGSTDARVFYTTQSGYDTHSAQQYDHSSLLREYADALKSFLDDLKQSGLDERVLVMTFSEFGRRVGENDSEGTDHGTAGPVFLAGSPVKGGVIGETPDLGDLENGDIKTQFDFRQVYASILKNWLDVDAKSVLEGGFESLSILANDG